MKIINQIRIKYKVLYSDIFSPQNLTKEYKIKSEKESQIGLGKQKINSRRILSQQEFRITYDGKLKKKVIYNLNK